MPLGGGIALEGSSATEVVPRSTPSASNHDPIRPESGKHGDPGAAAVCASATDLRDALSVRGDVGKSFAMCCRHASRKTPQRTLSMIKSSVQFNVGGRDIPKPITTITFLSLRQCIASGDRRVRTSHLEKGDHRDPGGPGRSCPPLFCNLRAPPLKPVLCARLQIADEPPGMPITPTIGRS
jgi:hypothetical protein